MAADQKRAATLRAASGFAPRMIPEWTWQCGQVCAEMIMGSGLS